MQHILTYESFFDPDPECQPGTRKSSLSDLQMEFELLLPMATTLVQQLADPEDRYKALAWIRKLRKESDRSKWQLRNEYLKLLIFVLQHKTMAGPFKKPPEGDLQPFPGNLDLMGMAKELQKEYKNAGFGDGPPVTAEASHDLKTYAAVQEIPGFGVQCYFAFSKKDPLPMWENGDKSFFPTKNVGLLGKPRMKKTNENIRRASLSPTQAMLSTTQRMQEYFPVQVARPGRATESELNTSHQNRPTTSPQYSHIAHSTAISRHSVSPLQPEPHLGHTMAQEGDTARRFPSSSPYNERHMRDRVSPYNNNTYMLPHPTQGPGYEDSQAARDERNLTMMARTVAIQPGEEYNQYPSFDYSGSSDDFFWDSVASPERDVYFLPQDVRERELNTWLEEDYNRGLARQILEDDFLERDWQETDENSEEDQTEDIPTVDVEAPENIANISLRNRERNLNAFLDRNQGMMTVNESMYEPDSELFGDTRTPYDLVGFLPGTEDGPETRFQFLDDRPFSQYDDVPPQDDEIYEQCWNQPADADYFPDPELQLHWIEGIGHY